MRNYQSKMAIISGLALVALILGFAGMAVSAVRSDAEYMIAAADAKADAATAQADKLQQQVDTITTEASDLQAKADALAARELLPDGMTAEYAGEYECTAYDANCDICDTTNITATGTKPTPGITAAADWDVLPAGTCIYIEGVGIRIIEDSGGAVQGNKIDVLVGSHQEAASWAGWGRHAVWILRGGATQ